MCIQPTSLTRGLRLGFATSDGVAEIGGRSTGCGVVGSCAGSGWGFGCGITAVGKAAFGGAALPRVNATSPAVASPHTATAAMTHRVRCDEDPLRDAGVSAAVTV
jgi:hypothetical protein